jgi:hypothetical protein
MQKLELVHERADTGEFPGVGSEVDQFGEAAGHRGNHHVDRLNPLALHSSDPI